MRTGNVTIYLDFPDIATAFAFQDVYELEGVVVRFWHVGKLVCENCGAKGHKTERHDETMESVARVRRKRAAARARRRRHRPAN